MNTEGDTDKDKIDDAALALLYLTMSTDKYGARAGKNIDWDVMDRLYEKGMISDPKSKAKSVGVTNEGRERAEKLFYELFSKK